MARPLKGILARYAGKFWRSPRVRKLELNSGPSKGKYNTPGLRNERLQGTVPSKAQQDAIWEDFNKVAKPQFLDKVRKEASITDLQAMGMSSAEAKAFTDLGELPEGYQVHHIVPRKLGGGNEMDNLVLIKNDPDHKLITAAQNAQMRGLPENQPFDVAVPTIPPGTVTWPRSGSAAYKR